MNFQSSADLIRVLDQDQDFAFGFEPIKGDFVVRSFRAHEKLHEPFLVEIELASRDSNIDLSELIDTNATLGIYDKYAEPRYINGIITEIERGGEGNHLTFYRVELRPALWRLSYSSDCKIWQQKSVPEIVDEVLKEHGVKDVETRFAGDYFPREYLTQLNETHLEFVSRILSEEGIYYYFEQNDGSHKLILADASISSERLPYQEVITYNLNSGGSSKQRHISKFSQRQRLRSTGYEINDYTFRNPNARMKEVRSATETNTTGNYSLYQYPGRYKDPEKVGKKIAQVRLDSTRVDVVTAYGCANTIHLRPGYQFELQDHTDESANGGHFITEVIHSGKQNVALQEEAAASGAEESATTYVAEFSTIPARVTYRPLMPRKPTVEGPQIAIVTGPESEEIYTDEFGRVKVWFPWDRYNKKDENSSTWIRVSQAWAGAGFGGMMIPRIGQEVIVAYLDGDIDQPIIIGRTFHAVNKVPNGLPAAKTQMSLRSQTHKGQGFNEMSFEDEAGKEMLTLKAQRDQSISVGNDETHSVTNNRTNSVGNDQTRSVGNNDTASIGAAYAKTVGTTYNKSVGTSATNSIGTSYTKSVGTDYTKSIGANSAVSITGNSNINVTGNESRMIVQNQETSVIGNSKKSVTGHGVMSTSQFFRLNVGTFQVVNTQGFKSEFVKNNSYLTVNGNSKHSVTGEVENLYGANQKSFITSNKEVSAGGKISYYAPTIEFSTGACAITLKPDGTVLISGAKIEICGDEVSSTATGENSVCGAILKLN